MSQSLPHREKFDSEDEESIQTYHASIHLQSVAGKKKQFRNMNRNQIGPKQWLRFSNNDDLLDNIETE